MGRSLREEEEDDDGRDERGAESIKTRVYALSHGRVVRDDARYRFGTTTCTDGYRARRVGCRDGILECRVDASEFGPVFLLTTVDGEEYASYDPERCVRMVREGLRDRSVVADGRVTTPWEEVFGFSDPTVARVIEALAENAGTTTTRTGTRTRKTTTRDWYTPTDEDIVEERRRAVVERARREAEEGTTRRIRRMTSVEKCDVCDSSQEYDHDEIVQCDECALLVHMGCYGICNPPRGQRWLCRACELGLVEPPACALCPNVGGAMKPTTCGNWCHVACALWVGATFENVDGVAEPIECSKLIASEGATCAVCRQKYGACTRCIASGECDVAFHVYCARDANEGYVTQSKTQRELRDAGLEFDAVYDDASRETDAVLFPCCATCAKRHWSIQPEPTARASPTVRTDEDDRQSGLIPYLVTGARRNRLESFTWRLQSRAALAKPTSLNERFQRMKTTIEDRVTIAKSAIHGFGLMAKVAHARGEMIIDYVGEIIRPSVADVRERDEYDESVGQGTYMFSLGGEAQMRLDATRAGNIANLANHSCEPNAHSRIISCDNAQHVCLFASRDIEAGEEITYDYRYGADEPLACACGAPTCRGWLNFLPLSESR